MGDTFQTFLRTALRDLPCARAVRPLVRRESVLATGSTVRPRPTVREFVCYELRLAGPEQPRSLRTAKIAAVLAVVLMLVVAERLGLLHELSAPSRAARDLVELGPWGYVAFVAAYTVLQPFGVPGTVFIVVAPLIWPWPVAFALSMTGTMAASVVGFSFARLVARDWMRSIIPARFQKYEDTLARRGFATVILLRLVFWMPPLLHAFFGVSRVGFWTHFWGSLVGYLLPLFLVSYFGQRVFDALRGVPLRVWLEGGLGVGAIVIGAWAARRRVGATSSTE